MGQPPDENDESWQQRTHVIRMGPIARPKAAGGDCLVIIYARNTSHLGKRYVLEADAGQCWVGRGADNNVVLESDTCSRKHAHFESRDDVWWVVDNNSTNGTYVNDDPVQKAPLKRGDHIKVGDTIFKYLAGTDVEAEFVETIREVMMRDGLTQAYNRRHLTEQIEKELHRARRYRRPLGLVMFDLDHFKRVNDTYGHLAGDFVLREAANIVREKTPAEGVFARYGGEEFALLLPEMPVEDVVKLAEAVRVAIEGHDFTFDGQRIPVTMSLGVGMATETSTSAEEFIKIADQRLYAAKHGGRNRVMY